MSEFQGAGELGAFTAIACASWLRLVAKLMRPKFGSLLPDMLNGAFDEPPPHSEPDKRLTKRFRSGSSAVSRSARRFIKLRIVSLVVPRIASSLNEFRNVQTAFVPATRATVTEREARNGRLLS